MSSRPRRRVRRSSDLPDYQTDLPRNERGSRRPLTLAAVVIAALVLVTLLGVAISSAATNADPDMALSLSLGGLPRRAADTPRNFRLWTAYPNGNVRFQAAYFPALADAAASEVVTIAGPLVNQPGDMLSISYFGALNIGGTFQAGPGADATRVYELFSVERDPGSESYGVNVLIANPPYLSVDGDDPAYRQLAMGAPPQDYYKQMIWALALPPGSTISSAAYQEGTEQPADMLRPYRKATLDGWIVYYFDVTALERLRTIRVRYLPPAAGLVPPADPDFWLADRSR